MITMKITDAAGNQAVKTSYVSVNLLSFLQDVSDSTLPEDSSAIEEDVISDTTQVTSSEPITLGSIQTTTDIGEYVTTDVSVASTTIPFTNIPLDPNILWGAAATAMVGATLADWQRRREEEERRRAEEQRLREERGDNQNIAARRAGLRAAETAVRERWADQRAEKERQASYNQHMEDKMAKLDTIDDAKWMASQVVIAQREKEKEEKQRLNDVAAARWAGVAAIEQEKEKEENKPKWWEKAINWVDNHQVEISIGVGVAVGVAAIILSGGAATPLVAAAWVAGAAAVAGGTIALGTVGLNAYYDRSLGTGVVRNILVAGVTAAVITGAALLAAPWVSTTIGAACTNYATACSQVGNIIDGGEEFLLAGQIAYYNLIADQDNAALAGIELQMERMDGGVPGNSITVEVGEQLAKLGPDAAELIGQHGSEIIPLLLRYGDDAIDIIGAYGDEGISLLTLHGKDAVKLIKEYGTPSVGLLTTYGDDAIEMIEKYGDDTFSFVKRADALGINPTKIIENPPNPGQSLDGWLLKIDDVNNPVNKKIELNLSENTIEDLAELSVHTGENEDLFVLGFYDRDHINGYVEVANKENATYFSMDEDLYTEFGFSGSTGDFWQVNQQAVMNAVEERKTFVLSTKYEEIKTNTSKSTWAEMLLILSPGNNYMLVEGIGDEYDRLVPAELLP